MGIRKNIVRQGRPGRDHLGLLALVVVYLVWGSTYLAIREAVRGANALGPFMLGALRMGLASALLFAIAAARGDKLRLTVRQSGLAAATGMLLWLGGNGLVIVGLTRLDSGLAAVLMATTPMWAALIGSFKVGRLPTARVTLGLLLGLAGVSVLTLSSGGSTAASLSGIVLVLIAAMSWALGSHLPSPGKSPLVNAAAIMWFAAIGFAIVSAARGEPLVMPGARAVIALAYLVVIGSAIGFVAYMIATERLALPLVMTHAQVNPLVAVVLGAIFAGESLTAATVLAAALIVSSIPLAR